MSDTSEPAGAPVQEPPAGAEPPAAQPTSGEVAVLASQGEVLEGEMSDELPPVTLDALEFENLQLLSRFLIGALLMGGGAFTGIMRDVQQEIEAQPQILDQDAGIEDESLRDLLRYLSIGLFVRGQKKAVGSSRAGFRLSLDATRWVLGEADRASDSLFARPFRRALAPRLQRLEREAELMIEEGRLEEQNAKLLTAETIDELIDQVVDAMAKSPELTDMVIELVGQQGAGMASVAGDNARSLSVIADNLSERLVARVAQAQAQAGAATFTHGRCEPDHVFGRRSHQGDRRA